MQFSRFVNFSCHCIFKRNRNSAHSCCKIWRLKKSWIFFCFIIPSAYKTVSSRHMYRNNTTRWIEIEVITSLMSISQFFLSIQKLSLFIFLQRFCNWHLMYKCLDVMKAIFYSNCHINYIYKLTFITFFNSLCSFY